MSPDQATDTISSTPPPGVGAAITSHSMEREVAPLSADDHHGHHLSQLGGHMVTVCVTLTVMILAFAFGTSAASPAAGAIAAVAVMVIAALIVYSMASSRAEEDFFESYATDRGLVRHKKGLLSPLTPLLRKGDRRRAEQIMSGVLPGGVDGRLAHYTYEIDSRDGDGDINTRRYEYTVLLCEVPELALHSSGLYCQRRTGFRFFDSASDVLRSSRRLELESEAFDQAYEVFFDRNDSENWLHQLFTPSFIVWMAESSPDAFAFEAVAGGICFNAKGHFKTAAELDGICEAAAVVCKRMHDEATE